MPVVEPAIVPRALNPAKSGIRGKTPPENDGTLMIRGDLTCFFRLDFLIELTATFMAECTLSGLESLIAIFAFFIKCWNVIEFEFDFFVAFFFLIFVLFLNFPPTLDSILFAFIAVVTANAVARSPNDASLAKILLNDSFCSSLSAVFLDFVSLALA